MQPTRAYHHCFVHVNLIQPLVCQVIDGQQRLTTLVMLLSYLRAWSETQPGLDSLAERVQRMLLIPADPLNPASKSRWGNQGLAWQLQLSSKALCVAGVLERL